MKNKQHLEKKQCHFIAVKLDPSVKKKFWLTLVKPTVSLSTGAFLFSLVSPSSDLHQIHILLTPHSQQNLADSTGYLVPQAWQNLLFIPPFPGSCTPSTSFLKDLTELTKQHGKTLVHNSSGLAILLMRLLTDWILQTVNMRWTVIQHAYKNNFKSLRVEKDHVLVLW